MLVAGSGGGDMKIICILLLVAGCACAPAIASAAVANPDGSLTLSRAEVLAIQRVLRDSSARIDKQRAQLEILLEERQRLKSCIENALQAGRLVLPCFDPRNPRTDKPMYDMER